MIQNMGWQMTEWQMKHNRRNFVTDERTDGTGDSRSRILLIAGDFGLRAGLACPNNHVFCQLNSTSLYQKSSFLPGTRPP